MKLSIWSHFSSNNSSSFTLIGHFRSVNAARIAQEEIISLLTSLAAWYHLPENAHLRRRMGPPLPFKGEPISPIEQEYSERFSIEWGDPIDWVRHPLSVRKAVLRFDTIVLIETGFEFSSTFMGCHPISTLMARLEGDAYCDGVDVTITATAPLLRSGHETMLLHDRHKDQPITIQSGAQVTFHINSFYDLMELLEQLEKYAFTNLTYRFNDEEDAL